MVVMLLGMATEVKLLQLENTSFPILFKLFGKVTDVRLLHPWNARSHIFVTLFGIVTDSRLVHCLYLQVVLYQLFVH